MKKGNFVESGFSFWAIEGSSVLGRQTLESEVCGDEPTLLGEAVVDIVEDEGWDIVEGDGRDHLNLPPKLEEGNGLDSGKLDEEASIDEGIGVGGKTLVSWHFGIKI